MNKTCLLREETDWICYLTGREEWDSRANVFFYFNLFTLGFFILAVGEIEPRAFAYAKHMLFQGSRIQMLSLVAVLSPWAPRGARLLGSLDFLVCAGEGSVDAHLEMHTWRCTGLLWGEGGPQRCSVLTAGCVPHWTPCSLPISTQKACSTHWLDICRQMSNFKTLKPLCGPGSWGGAGGRGGMYLKHSECRKSKFLSTSKQTECCPCASPGVCMPLGLPGKLIGASLESAWLVLMLQLASACHSPYCWVEGGITGDFSA